MAPQGAQSAHQGTQKARMRAPAVCCVGCDQPASAGSGIDPRALHTIASRNRCCRKGLEPVRRLRTAAGPSQLRAVTLLPSMSWVIPAWGTRGSCGHDGHERRETDDRRRDETHGFVGPAVVPPPARAGSRSRVARRSRARAGSRSARA